MGGCVFSLTGCSSGGSSVFCHKQLIFVAIKRSGGLMGGGGFINLRHPRFLRRRRLTVPAGAAAPQQHPRSSRSISLADLKGFFFLFPSPIKCQLAFRPPPPQLPPQVWLDCESLSF